MTLQGFFDESDRQDGNEPICLAGYLFYPGSYVRFVRRWRRFLRRARPGGLTHLHMTDLYAGQGEYAGIGDRRTEILREAVGCIKEHVFAGVAVVFEKAEFERSAPAWLAEHLGSIYTVACQICLRASSVWLEDHDCQQLVAYTFESGHKFQSEADAILQRVAAVSRVQDTHRYQTHAFADKKLVAGLQAADLLAWTVTRANVGFATNRTMRLFAPHLLSLTSDSSKYQLNIFTDQKLRRFFQEQVIKPEDYYFQKPPEFRGKLR